MSSVAIDPGPGWGRGLLCLVGYGNTCRGDDGLGPYVVGRVAGRFMDRADFRCLIRQQLDPDLLEDLRGAVTVIMVDATVECVPEGWRWERVFGGLDRLPPFLHSCRPDFLVGLLAMLYRSTPVVWLVSIQGEDFGFRTGLSRQAEGRARQVITELTTILSKEGIHGRRT